ALVVRELLRPVSAILAQRHFLRHPVDLLLALPIFERPWILERLVLLAGFEEGHWLRLPAGVRGSKKDGEEGQDRHARADDLRRAWLRADPPGANGQPDS